MPLSVPLPLAPLVQLVVALPLLTPLPPICRRLHLSLRHGLPCLLSGWLPRRLSSHRHLPSAGNSASNCLIASCHACLRAIASCTSSLASCCVASPHTATSHLPVPLPLVVLSRLVTPLLGLLSGWLLRCLSWCLLLQHCFLCLLSGWLLHCP
jgi:hypothetical protein